MGINELLEFESRHTGMSPRGTRYSLQRFIAPPSLLFYPRQSKAL